MSVREYLERELQNGCGEPDDMVEVRHEDDSVVGFMSIEDMLDSGAEYLDMEYVNTDVQEDGTYIIVIE